ncbi:uncharacterized protein LOC107264363 isoform X2 [Cephus cinctus]|uniref:Uncharacterized protein LOC107264363 isoform X2 n=1 Tax=Cephus cinctus TaxID=211228 RepID=A0AAJ7R9U0_CEPCN|nr:uncharacterized protein LOC107264363 isoform X2 [Cephus cinctus]
MSASSGKTRERRDKNEVDFQMKMESKKTERNVYERYTDCTKGPITFDNIWKEVVRLERKLQREWGKRYGHLSGEMLKQEVGLY